MLPVPSWLRETWFAISHPIAANDIGSYKKGASNISTNAVRFSTRGVSAESESILKENKDKGNENKGNENKGSQINAVRHTLWQAAIASKYGAAVAKEAGDAHEDNPDAIKGQSFAQLLDKKFSSSEKADEAIDLSNNETGRNIGTDNKGAGMKDLAGKVLDTFAQIGLYTSYLDDQGNTRITVTKITPEQYKQLLDVIKTLDNTGRTIY
ncbi:DUF6973 domain-containing protein [Deminuibacter soli]|uniref:DUF6973 domain-containing protein n=1 Tax=Deminuibacter soli TaxID=2291815 RepID=A0A3E1NMC7_9BACT|nr:hypothetical protein [Deminuibacter soli]RFM29061.1 hypothetical protein DXN05_09900 [Deminuibacter soli]